MPKRKSTAKRKISKPIKSKKNTENLFLRPFTKKGLLEAALMHPSYRNENIGLNKLENFDRLEFLGDSILNFVICQKLYRIFPEADEGLLSRLRSILVSRKILFRVACKLDFAKHMKVGKGLARQKQFLKSKLFSDGLEAVIAAIFFDQGFKKAEAFILKNFREFFDAKKLFRLDPNPKSSLQELAQKHWQKLPVYQAERSGANIKAVVCIDSVSEASALGRNRQEAEEKAARLLIRTIRQDLLGKKSSRKKLRKIF